jgi:hypothetical protein
MRVPEAGIIPWWGGIAYFDPCSRYAIVLPVPLHLIVRYWRMLWLTVRFGGVRHQAKIDKAVEAAVTVEARHATVRGIAIGQRNGHRDGYKEGFEAGVAAAHKQMLDYADALVNRHG